MAWGIAGDPDLLATFQAEVEERLASLSAGLLALEGAPRPAVQATALLRDAHTVKGSARMLGLDGVVEEAHRMEDLLAAVRDGRRAPGRELIDALLASCDAIGRAVGAPGGGPSAPDAGPSANGGTPPDGGAALEGGVRRGGGASPEGAHLPSGVGRQATVRVDAARVHGLLDHVGQMEVGARQVAKVAGRALALVEELASPAVTATDAPCGAAFGRGHPAGVVEDLSRQLGVLAELSDDHADRVRDLRVASLGLAMVPLARVLGRFPRLVRDLTARAGKQARLVVQGESIEIDQRVLDTVAEALAHLVSNAVEHGCEVPDVRRAAGKPEVATIGVCARLVGPGVVIEVSDDGPGVDEAAVVRAAVAAGVPGVDSATPRTAALDLLFAPAVSTRGQVTLSSGRGIGLDAVRAVVRGLGGSVEVVTRPGEGTTFSVGLPLTLGVLHCLFLGIGDESYAVAVASVDETLLIRHADRAVVCGTSVLVHQGGTWPWIDLGSRLGCRSAGRDPKALLLVRVGAQGFAVAVDRVSGEAECVVKSLGPFLAGRVPGVSGAIVDADGRLVPLLDLRTIVATAPVGDPPRTGGSEATGCVDTPASYVGPHGSTPDPPADPRPGSRADLQGPQRLEGAADGGPAGSALAGSTTHATVLVVEDSLGVRELERVVLERAGYRVRTAVDGLDGATHLSGLPVDLVICDVEMPGLDGIAFTRRLRGTPGWEQVPVVIMTSRGADSDRRAGLEAGADAYLLKSDFDQADLVTTVRRLVGR